MTNITDFAKKNLWRLAKGNLEPCFHQLIIFDLLYDQHYWTGNNLDASLDQLVSEAILNACLEPLAEHVDVHLDKIDENLNFNELPVSTLCTSISSSCFSSFRFFPFLPPRPILPVEGEDLLKKVESDLNTRRGLIWGGCWRRTAPALTGSEFFGQQLWERRSDNVQLSSNSSETGLPPQLRVDCTAQWYRC